MKAVAAELKTQLLFSDRFDDKIVSRLAEVLGIARRTVYAVLSGDIDLYLDFLHACVIVTCGDPEVRTYLEPEGYRLTAVSASPSDKPTLAQECLDDVPALARFHNVLNDPSSTMVDVTRAEEAVIDEIRQNSERFSIERARG
jgi:hypothetical protein